MQVGRTTQELAKEIIRQQSEKYDIVANGKSLKLLHEGSPEYIERTGASVLDSILDGRPEPKPTEFILDTGEQGTLKINDWAHGQLAQKLGIPKKYYDRCRTVAPELLLENANHWFASELEDKSYLVRTLDGYARAFLSSRYRCIDNVDIASLIFELVQDLNLNVKANEVTDTQLNITAVSPRLEGEVKAGDVVQAGISVRNSEVGSGRYKITKWLYRLWCSNGCGNQEILGQRHLGTDLAADGDLSQVVLKSETQELKDAALFSETRDVIRHALSDEVFEKDLNVLREAAGVPITGPVEKVCERISKKLELSKPESSGLLNNLAADGDLTKWGALNAVTKLAHDAESYDRNTELQELGGKVLEFSTKEWKAINAE